MNACADRGNQKEYKEMMFMRLPRSLRKTIAAALAFTTLTVPLAGCSRTVTTGGLSGKGVLGDFLVGGLYGGVFGDFMRPGETLPEGAFVLKLPRVNDTRLGTELVTMDTLRYYVRARLLTEKLSRATPQNTSPEELAKLVQETASAWECTETFAALSQKCAQILEREEKKPGYKPLAFLPPPASSPFFSVACAREGWGDERTPEQAEREDRERDRRDSEMRKNSPELWQREICNAYRDAPAGNKLNTLAARLGTDAKTAKAELDKVSYQIGADARKEATAYTVATNAALVTKAGCQVGLYFGTTALTCGATGPAAIAGGINAVASGVDLIVDLSNTASELATEHTNPTLDKIKQYTGTISAITNLGALTTTAITTSMKDFAIKGKDAVTASQKALQSIGFGSQGALDSYNIASNGVNNWVTAGSWMKDRVDEARDGKVFGFKVGSTEDGNTVVYPKEFAPEDVPKPTPLAELPDKSLGAAIEESGAPPYHELSQEARSLLDQSDPPRRIVERSGRNENAQETRKQEQAKEETRTAETGAPLSEENNAEERKKKNEDAAKKEPDKSSSDVWDSGTYEQQRLQTINDLKNILDQPGAQGQAADMPFTPEKIAGTYVLITQREFQLDNGRTITWTAKFTASAGADGRIDMEDDKGLGASAYIDPQTGKGSIGSHSCSFQSTGSGGYTIRFTGYEDGISATYQKQ